MYGNVVHVFTHVYVPLLSIMYPLSNPGPEWLKAAWHAVESPSPNYRMVVMDARLNATDPRFHETLLERTPTRQFLIFSIGRCSFAMFLFGLPKVFFVPVPLQSQKLSLPIFAHWLWISDVCLPSFGKFPNWWVRKMQQTSWLFVFLQDLLMNPTNNPRIILWHHTITIEGAFPK